MEKDLINIPPGFKSSPLGQIPNDWEIKRLIDCCLIRGEYGINAAAVDFSSNLPTYLRITDIDDDGNYSKNKKVSVNDENSRNFILRNGDIVFARTGATVGKTYLYNEKDGELVYAGFLIRFRPDQSKLLPDHLKYFTLTKTYWDWVKTTSMRSGQPGINAEEYGLLKLPLPPLLEQTAIAACLSTWDKAINNCQLIIDNCQLRKKWLMQQLLTGRKRLPGFDGEWNKTSLGTLGDFLKGSGITKRDLIVNGKPCIRYGEIYTTHDTVIKLFFSFISQEKAKESTPIYQDDILFAGSGETKEEIGKCVAFIDNLEAYAGGDIIILRTKNVNSLFVTYLLNSDNLNKVKSQLGKGHSVVHIYAKDLAEINFKIPSQNEQLAIVTVLQAADKEINLLKTKLDKLKEQKRGLMQVLLTGRKRLSTRI